MIPVKSKVVFCSPHPQGSRPAHLPCSLWPQLPQTDWNTDRGNSPTNVPGYQGIRLWAQPFLTRLAEALPQSFVEQHKYMACPTEAGGLTPRAPQVQNIIKGLRSSLKMRVNFIPCSLA